MVFRKIEKKKERTISSGKKGKCNKRIPKQCEAFIVFDFILCSMVEEFLETPFASHATDPYVL